MAPSRVTANQNMIARIINRSYFYIIIIGYTTKNIKYRNNMGFCEALMAPSGVAANQNTIASIINKTYCFYIINIG